MDPTNDAGNAADTAAPTAPAAEPAPAPAAAASAAAASPAAPAPAPASTLLTAAADKPADAPTAEAGDKPADAPKPEAKPADGEHAPEEYADFTLGEGQQLDEEFLGDFKPLAKELDLPQGKAQKLAELGAKHSQRLGQKFVTDLQQRVDANAKEWEAAVKADPEIGGAQHEEAMGRAVKALDTFGSPEFKAFLQESRLGSNPELIRMLARVGKAISQDGAIPGRASNAPKTDGEVFYGKS